ncbi:unnamed protein product [Parnassius apollo]|uniref:(apollo) hypothetical protein n=1 Tax=Parnassius apollo TaxID=110799 RepID=A0A8S3X3N0_PARAO|nr:unnamed protein product [Parnassius apollo]
MPGGVRTRGGRVGRRGRGVRTRGGTQQRPNVSDDVNIGVVEELPTGSPLVVSSSKTHSIWQPTASDIGGYDARGDVAGGNDTGGDDADIQGEFQ